MTFEEVDIELKRLGNDWEYLYNLNGNIFLYVLSIGITQIILFFSLTLMSTVIIQSMKLQSRVKNGENMNLHIYQNQMTPTN